jgi:hypothetical protein
MLAEFEISINLKMELIIENKGNGKCYILSWIFWAKSEINIRIKFASYYCLPEISSLLIKDWETYEVSEIMINYNWKM